MTIHRETQTVNFRGLPYSDTYRHSFVSIVRNYVEAFQQAIRERSKDDVEYLLTFPCLDEHHTSICSLLSKSTYLFRLADNEIYLKASWEIFYYASVDRQRYDIIERLLSIPGIVPCFTAEHITYARHDKVVLNLLVDNPILSFVHTNTFVYLVDDEMLIKLSTQTGIVDVNDSLTVERAQIMFYNGTLRFNKTYLFLLMQRNDLFDQYVELYSGSNKWEILAPYFNLDCNYDILVKIVNNHSQVFDYIPDFSLHVKDSSRADLLLMIGRGNKMVLLDVLEKIAYNQPSLLDTVPDYSLLITEQQADILISVGYGHKIKLDMKPQYLLEHYDQLQLEKYLEETADKNLCLLIEEKVTPALFVKFCLTTIRNKPTKRPFDTKWIKHFFTLKDKEWKDEFRSLISQTELRSIHRKFLVNQC